MHQSAQAKIHLFLTHCAEVDPDIAGKTILDVGSCIYQKKADEPTPAPPTWRVMSEKFGLKYVGLDIAQGFNVDLVTRSPFVWDEIGDESFDYVISSSVFEHNPFFWVTFAEIARTLRQNGKAFIIAPASGRVHRYPLDCWRFYPDSWSALCHLTGLRMDEMFMEPKDGWDFIGGSKEWWDSSVIASKPAFDTPGAQAAFYERLVPFVAPYREFKADLRPQRGNSGPVYRRYVEYVRSEVERRQKAAGAARPPAQSGRATL